MKILKIFGVVVGIHVVALILIFANPGCSSPRKPAPTATDTMPGDPAASAAPTAASSDVSPIMSAPADGSGAAPHSFDPNAPATTVRFSPTRPGSSAAGALEAQPVTDVTPATTYTVGKGDSLWTIAKKQHITIAELTAANNLRASSAVHVGQKLIIPGKPPGVGSARTVEPAASKAAVVDKPVAPATSPRGSAESVRHVVRPGETLGAIARKYQVKVGEIATANNISDPAKIRPGMELMIPGWQTPSAAKTGKSTSTARPKAEPTPVVETPKPVVPPVEQDLDAGLKSTASEPPVIQVEQKP
jgi:LysM repeat protein